MPPRKRLTVADGHKLLPSARQSLTQLPAADAEKDAGLRRLVEVYATAIDEAVEQAVDARKLVAKAEDPDDPLDVPKRLLNALVKFSDSTAVLEQLGPKLQSALEALGASPKARAAMTPKKPGGGSKPDASSGKPEPTSLERRRAASAAREQSARAYGSSTVDPSA
jgi:hypothetical protein